MKIYKVESPNYIFADLVISAQTKPGTFTITLSGGGLPAEEVNYELKAKSKDDGKTRVQGISSRDFLYLLIPDRFSNGDPTNDVIPEYRDQIVDRKSMFARHGGDFKGIENHFDYFKQLGVTALWLTPIIENNTSRMNEGGQSIAGYHGYWFTDHYQIDRRLGGNEGYVEFCKAAHSQGLKVVQDAIYNHISKEHFFAMDPPTKDWINNWPEFTSPNHREETLFDPYGSAYDKKRMLDGWFTDHLPDLNQRNPLLATFLIQHAIWSTEYFGVDAWRVDTYKYCDEHFLNNVNAALEREFPGITIFGEAWVNSVVANAYFTQNTMGAAFKHNANSVIDFQTCFALLNAMGLSQGWTDGVYRLYMTLAQDFIYKNPMRNCIFLDNHDMDRVFSVVDEDWGRLKMGLTWLLTLRGIPQLYYGTEVLMKNKKTTTDATVREDFPGGWEGDPVSRFTGSGRSPEQNEAFNYVSTLANFRKSSSALTTGRTMQYVPYHGLYTYFRYDNKQTIVVITNTVDEPAHPRWETYAERTQGFTRVRNIITGLVTPLDQVTLKGRDCFVGELIK
jgi:glycosidase